MKKINKWYIMFIVCFLMISSFSLSYANDFTSKHMVLENDVNATLEKKYPVIIATNTTDVNLEVNYDFYVGEESDGQVIKKIMIPANQSVIIEIPELEVLGSTGQTRRVWFSWNERNARKPLQNEIDTHPFKNEEKIPTELG